MDNFLFNLFVALPGFLFGIVVHEAAHAWMALRFGDDTSKRLGRLSLNPLVHYDLIGTIIFPLIGAAIGGVMFGWAKPVPVVPRNFSNYRKGIFWVSFAGPISNIVLAIIFCVTLALLITQVNPSFAYYSIAIKMLQTGIIINLVLAVFNLIPFPPLDGSKMVSSFLDYESAIKYEGLQRFSFIFIILLWTTNIFSYIFMPAYFFYNKFMAFLLNLMQGSI